MLRGRFMRRLGATNGVVVLCASVLAGPALAGKGNGNSNGNSVAGVWVEFYGDCSYATIESSKGISHYVVELANSEVFKVELSGDENLLTVGGYGSAIESVKVKSGTTYQTFECPDAPSNPPPVDCEDIELDTWPEECWDTLTS